MDTDLHYIYDEFGKQMNTEKDIHIGNDVWIGIGSIIKRGIKIGDGVIIVTTHKEFEDLTDAFE